MLGRFGRRRDDHASRAAAPERPGRSPDEGVDSLLVEIAAMEAAAAGVYGRHGLPDQPGQYRQRGREGAWEKVADDLTPAEKWAMIEAAPPKEGWRFASLEHLGARSRIAEVRQAAALLTACRGLRARLTEEAPISPQDLADAIRLGASWRRLSNPGAPLDAAGPLLFLPPEGDD
ncbi:hypothetical protein D8I30_03255 [Brevundimonas naejangsanensis]|uniref:Uncharacterized protein n=1 Tax=Brevundimonas naejangsanensis TaxID=588932 RepID=A0A494RDT0_9CAUL|nr:hypothetical protein [Brevundimonas naejangsanensis]AYG94311.1 hypothetical protein D8I30_03255 [Brevundimonas naejangsanensis]